MSIRLLQLLLQYSTPYLEAIFQRILDLADAL